MLRGLVAAAFAAALALGVSSANAVPLANLDGAASPHVTLIYGGCGIYGHRGPYGGCRPGGQAGGWNGGYWRGVYYPAGACPLGYHLGPQGRLCWPN